MEIAKRGSDLYWERFGQSGICPRCGSANTHPADEQCHDDGTGLECEWVGRSCPDCGHDTEWEGEPDPPPTP